MAKTKNADKNSAFDALGLRGTVDAALQEVREIYCADRIPWVVGYSGGKDSTAALQLIWLALAGLEPARRAKPVHVISTDTLVENPVVAAWVTGSLGRMQAAAAAAALPLETHRLTPSVPNSYWVNLLGRGYPAPRHKFRWCTERLKISPSNDFINNVVKNHGEAILVLGTRRAESTIRARSMDMYSKKSHRERLSANAHLQNTLVYTPLGSWTNDDVWLFLMQYDNPWGHDNKELLAMYRGASQDGECPLVVDTSTPSCGKSRFGCWVCTLVEEDKSMSAMIQNDEEKDWMLPLVAFRNEIDFRVRGPEGDRPLRDFRRMRGNVQMFKGRPVPGPYTQVTRERWLRRLLEVQTHLQQTGPQHVRGYDLITLAELEEIRRIWVVEKHEIEDALPTIYKEATGRPYPGSEIDEDRPFTATEMELLREVCGEDRILYELARELIDIEHSFRAKSRRLGIYNDLKDAIKRGFYKTELDAVTYAQSRAEQKDEQRRRTQSVADAEAVSDYIRQLELSIGDNQG